MALYDHLNERQRQAVLTTRGRVLVLAGAGSGKTSVLSHRIAHLILEEKVPPSQILGLTFTNKAAGEMRGRVAKLIGSKAAKLVTLSTFHSFCMQILRKEIHHLGFTRHFSLYDEKDVRRLLTQIVRHSLEHEGELPSLQGTMEKISLSKNKGLTKIELDETENPSSWHAHFSQDLLERLHTSMRSYNAVDFDSLLTLSVRLFEEHPSILEQFQDLYRFIMIDEYQDTNPIQYKLANLLASKYQNLCVVGDDDQSIYGWRGAEIRFILQFPYDTLIKLEQNYRSTPTILQAANRVIANNKERHLKELWSTKDLGSPIMIFHAPNEIDEAQAVAQRMICLRKEKGLKWQDMAILYRSNALSRAFEIALNQYTWQEDGVWKRGIPYEVFGGTEFYERAEIKDLLAYLRVIENPLDEEALLRILNVPRRGISEACLDKLTQHNRTEKIPLWNLLTSLHKQEDHPLRQSLSTKALQGIASFLALMENVKRKIPDNPLRQVMEEFIEKIDYRKAIREDAKSEKMRDFKWENVVSCLDTLSRYEEGKKQEGLVPSLQDFLGSMLLQAHSPQEMGKETQGDKVHLMTIHSAKGLEFEACFLVCLEDHIMPHEKSLEEEGLEEERRLMYVAMTRAKRYLTLSMAKERKKMGQLLRTTPSRFLFEIPKELFKISSYQIPDIP